MQSGLAISSSSQRCICPMRTPPLIHGYRWAWSCGHETRSDSVRGSRGVACLIQNSIQNKVIMLSSNEHAKFLWVWFHQNNPLLRNIYIAVCYFPPASSHFALHMESEETLSLTFMLISPKSQYSTIREVILLGDFNARTRNLQISLHDRTEDALCLQELEPESMCLHRSSQDKDGPLIGYGRHLLQLGESHDLLIMNGLCYRRICACAKPHYKSSNLA
jgi:hypothetical protein